MSNNAPTIPVTLAYAEHDNIYYVDLVVPQGTTIAQVIELSKVQQYFPATDFAALSVGIFNQLVDSNYVVAAGERVEIYRPLLIDPKEARLKRATKTQPDDVKDGR